MKTVLAIVIVLALGAGGVALYKAHASAGPTENFRTVAVQRGDLASTISATGTVEPEEVIDVGSQIVGIIKDLGIDPSDPAKKKRVDYRSVVHPGMDLAYIDDAVYKAQADQAQATLQHAEADLRQYKARTEQMRLAWKRAQDLHDISESPTGTGPLAKFKAISDADFEQAQADYESAQSNEAVAEASIEQAKAALDLAKTNLGYTVIKSPVEGVIIDRRVNVGQTVVSSLSASSLFLIAKDLSRIQVWASVNEADIGRIKVGMPVKFTIDAFSGVTFHGKVDQIRFNATMNQNVVTYTVVVTTDNSNGKLYPYLTANLKFMVDHLRDVTLVPNAALRWVPRPEQIAPDIRAAVVPTLARAGGSNEAHSPHKSSADGKNKGKAGAANDQKAAQSASEREEPGRLWVEDGAYVRPLDVQVGPSDGTITEIKGDKVKEGLVVVMGESHAKAEADDSDTQNPLVPHIFRGNKPKPKE